MRQCCVTILVETSVDDPQNSYPEIDIINSYTSTEKGRPGQKQGAIMEL
jgi:hypothetical protein